MRYSLLAGAIALSCIHVFVLPVCARETSGTSTEPDSHLYRRLQPRTDVITIPIHSTATTVQDYTVLEARSPGNNKTFGAGLSTVSLSSDRQSYFAVIKAGATNLRVALDTASSDLWVFSSACESESCRKVPRYPLAYQSPTFVSVTDNTTKFSASYADTTFASGYVARESIRLANITLDNQAFGVVTDSNVSFTDDTSGIMGLGFSRLSPISASGTDFLPFFARLAQQSLLEYPLFALSLTRNSSGSLTLGAIDGSVVTNMSRIGWNKVAQFPPFSAENNISSYLQWSIPLTGISVNGTQFDPIPTYASIGRIHSLALFDVGTPGIYGPYQDVARIYALIDGARLVDPSGQWAIPCTSSVPLAFTFGLWNYTLQATDYIIGPASGNPNLCLSWPRALPPNSDGIDWQMGSAFLRTVYSIFSFGINGKEPPMIGLYPLSNATNTTVTPDTLSSFLSANSATVATTLPNFILPTPTFTTPPFALNTSVPASIGGIVSSGLANSTYTALLGTRTALTNTSALPTIHPPPAIITLVVTNPAGVVATTVSTVSAETYTLGFPPGWTSAATSIHYVSTPISILTTIIPSIVLLWTLFSLTDAVAIGVLFV
ncbi:aspartic peptidase domain-containing protein [Crassisporium funariophilum]|nr:aspartic peptidase domain-containing protein [Crassisporium funariophilum]